MHFSIKAPLRAVLPLALICSAGTLAWPRAAEAQIADSIRTLDGALETAFQAHPRLEAASRHVDAQSARVDQAGRFLNPELEVEAEEWPFSDAPALIGASIGQTFELGGDRRARRRLAAASLRLAEWERTAATAFLAIEVRAAFARVQIAQARFDIARQQEETTRRFAKIVTTRADVGVISPLDAQRAEIEHEQAHILTETARASLEVTRAALATHWGGTIPVARAPELDIPDAVPSLAALRSRLGQAPPLAQQDAVRRGAEARLALERAVRVPNPTVRAGPVWLAPENEVALSAGLSIPIPLNDANGSAITAARIDVERTEALTEALRRDMEGALEAAYNELSGAVSTARRVRDEVLPAAESLYASIHIGYKEGEFGLLDVLDAQRSLLESRTALVDHIEILIEARADIERLLAAPLVPTDSPE